MDLFWIATRLWQIIAITLAHDDGGDYDDDDQAVLGLPKRIGHSMKSLGDDVVADIWQLALHLTKLAKFIDDPPTGIGLFLTKCNQ